MTSLSARDEIISLIYAALQDPANWTRFLEKFALAMNSDQALFLVAYPGHVEWTISLSVGMTDADKLLYAERYAQDDPWLTAEGTASIPVGRIVASQELCPDHILEQTAIYKELLEPRGWQCGAGVTLARSDYQISSLTFARPRQRGLITPKELDFWNSLVPHLLRAVSLHDTFHRLRSEAAVLQAYFDDHPAGLALTNRKGSVLVANARARQFQQQADGLRFTGGIVTACGKKEAESLARLIDEAGTPDRLPPARDLQIQRSAGKSPLTVRVAPLRGQPLEAPGALKPAVLLQIIDPDARAAIDPSLLKGMFVLTPSEAQVAALIGSGLTLAETATQLFVSPNTVRTHLNRALEKTGAHRQPELVALVARLSAQVTLPRTTHR